MPICKEREYRIVAPFTPSEGREFFVEGYASTFDTYALLEEDGVTYYERILPTAFEGADMRDVIMQYDHAGMVFARQRNGSLELTVDERGLHVSADLSRTADARNLYENIKAGMVDQMSFAFTVAADSYDKDSHTRVIERFKRIYDVSAVSIPANPYTQISARSYFDGVIEAERAERLAAEKRAKRAQKIKILCEVNKCTK